MAQKYRDKWESAGVLWLPKVENMLERIDNVAKNRQEFIREAIREKLYIKERLLKIEEAKTNGR